MRNTGGNKFNNADNGVDTVSTRALYRATLQRYSAVAGLFMSLIECEMVMLLGPHLLLNRRGTTAQRLGVQIK